MFSRFRKQGELLNLSSPTKSSQSHIHYIWRKSNKQNILNFLASNQKFGFTANVLSFPGSKLNYIQIKLGGGINFIKTMLDNLTWMLKSIAAAMDIILECEKSKRPVYI